MSLSWEPSFSEEQLREYVEAQKEEDRKVIDSLEIGLAQADNKIGELEEECKTRDELIKKLGEAMRGIRLFIKEGEMRKYVEFNSACLTYDAWLKRKPEGHNEI